jgi:acetyl-CoA C-acetyltransferase
MPETWVVAAKRTPIGKFGGALKDVPAVELGAQAIRATVAQAGIEGAEIDYAYMGIVVQAGVGQIPSRQATVRAGLPVELPSDTINRVCASSLRAVNLGDMSIRLGEAKVVLAGGMESMSQAPYLLYKARYGYRMGNGELVDSVVHDGLWCAFGDVHMGVHGGRVALEMGVSRQEMDEWSYRSQMRAKDAMAAGRLDDEIVPVQFGKAELAKDEGPRPDTTLERLAQLKPVFDPTHGITAGNAPALNDGGSAVLLMEASEAQRRGLKPLARILSHGAVSQDPAYLATVPALSAQQALERAGLKAKDLALVEINEAFAAVAITSTKMLGVDPEIVNPNGGAVAFGHPIGASGARILMTLIYELRRRGGGYGVAAICSGGGQGEATVVRVDA